MTKKCCKKELVFDETDLSVSQAKCNICGAHYQSRTGSFLLFKTTNNGDDWNCTTCGSEIQGTTVYHPIHDGPFPLSGSGKVYKECVPYCPKCEEEPNSSGSFINK